MKKSLFTILFIYSLTTICLGQEDRSGGKSYKYQPSLGNGVFKEDFKANKVQGSPYLISSFFNVKVDGVNEKSKMRYNVFKDEFEFIGPKNDTLILEKIEDFKTLTFENTNTKYQLVNYINLDEKFEFGYLINIFENQDFGLFKKETMYFTEEKIAKTTLEQTKPAKYSNGDAIYFLKSKDKVFEFPKNKKRLCKLFEIKKEAIENFVKENKIDFDKESDKIKVVKFLSGL